MWVVGDEEERVDIISSDVPNFLSSSVILFV